MTHSLESNLGGAAGATNRQGGDPRPSPIVFLGGPPGSGKSTLGGRVCFELGLRFVNLPDGGGVYEALEELVATGGADVVSLPWAPERDARWFGLCRRSGETVALWAHPLDMQARSGRAEQLFTPVAGLPSTNSGG